MEIDVFNQCLARMLFLKIFSNKEVRQKKAKAKNVENTAKKKDFLDQTNLVEKAWEIYSNGMDSSDEDNLYQKN